MRQCAHTNKRGTRCRRSAQAGSVGDLCGVHRRLAGEIVDLPAPESMHGAEVTPHDGPSEYDPPTPDELAARSVFADRHRVVQSTLPGVDLAMRPPEEAKRQAALGQWFTPPELAAEIAIDADVRGRRVLEPSAGDGAIVQACLDAGADCVLAVEIDPAMAAKLRERFRDRNVDVVEGDFIALGFGPGEPLDLSGFDVIAGNPPYDDGVDGDHLARIAEIADAFRDRATIEDWQDHNGLRSTLGAALLLRTVALHSGDRFERVWERLAITRLRPCADRIAFPAAGDTTKKAEPGKIDVSIFRVCLRDDLPPDFVQPITWIKF